jgi:hypothetical protein
VNNLIFLSYSQRGRTARAVNFTTSPDHLPWPGRIAAYLGHVAPTCRSLNDRAFFARAGVAVIANVARVVELH